MTPETAEAVQKAMRELAFEPRLRPRFPRQPGATGQKCRVAFLMFGAGTASPAPSFQRLLYGASQGADAAGVSLTFSYIDDFKTTAAKLQDMHADGLLLHGLMPDAATVARISHLPTVWLMANRTARRGATR